MMQGMMSLSDGHVHAHSQAMMNKDKSVHMGQSQ